MMRIQGNWTGLAILLLAVGCSGTAAYALPSSAQTPRAATGKQSEAEPQPETDVDMTVAPSDSSAPPAGDAAEPGLAVGTVAPAFVLRNQANEDVSLAQLLSSHNVALVFFRSANW